MDKRKEEVRAELEALKLPINYDKLFTEPEEAIKAIANAISVCVDYIHIGWAVENQSRHLEALKKAIK